MYKTLKAAVLAFLLVTSVHSQDVTPGWQIGGFDIGFASSSCSEIVVVQEDYAAAFTDPQTVTLTGVTAGNALIVQFSITTGNLTSVTDDNGNSYTQDHSETLTQDFYAYSDLDVAAGNTTVTVDASATSDIGLSVVEAECVGSYDDSTVNYVAFGSTHDVTHTATNADSLYVGTHYVASGSPTLADPAGGSGTWVTGVIDTTCAQCGSVQTQVVATVAATTLSSLSSGSGRGAQILSSYNPE